MQAGKLDRLVTIQQDQGAARDTNGEHVPEWRTLGQLWVSIKALKGGEVWFAHEAQGEQPSELRGRYSSEFADLTGSVRIVYEPEGLPVRTFHLVSANNTMERGRELVLGCTEAPDKTGGVVPPEFYGA